ncbi:hypothetical protein Q3G72_028754 [Acer saccharum]|nr:hypothetical protein Q3G72_028754 [Acer saccharum]
MKLYSSSSSSSSSSIFLSSLFVFILFRNVEAVGNNAFPAVIMFGDSIVDTGNNNNLNSPTKSNFPPYGRDFMGGVPTGRFSNGKVPSDFLVEELGIKELLPAYLDPNLKPEDLLTGVSFASGGSGYDPATAKLEVATPLFNQLQQFQEYKEKLKVIAGEEGTNTILRKSLFVVVASSNDIANTYFNFRIREFQFNLFTYTDLLVGSASTFLQCPSLTMFWFYVYVFVFCCCAEAARELARNNEFPAIIFFGDSIVDPGNNNNRLFALAKSNFPPYGRDFIGGVATGRFSNGKIPTDFIVEKLGIKELLPAYLDPNLRPEDLLTGVSFGSGGCGYDPLTSELVSAISFEDQLKMFQEYIEKLKQIAGEESTNTILTKGLFGVVASSNDIANVYFDTHIRQLQYNIFNYTDFLVGSASTFLQELYELGARKIAVFGAPPLGCLPASITFAGEIISREKCVEAYNQAAKLFSDKLSAEVDRLNSNLADVKLVYIDIYHPLLDLIQNPNKYGFGNVDRGCCGTGIIETSALCNPLSFNTCTNASSYLFWDSYHPTEQTYKILVSNIMKKKKLLKSTTEAAIKLAGDNTFPAVIFFGDSIVDTGNNNYVLTVAKCNFPPYGKDFIGGKATGRFCNGKVPPDFVVEKLGIKELLPPYLDPNLKSEDLLTGVSFASGASGYDSLTSELVVSKLSITVVVAQELLRHHFYVTHSASTHKPKNHLPCNTFWYCPKISNTTINAASIHGKNPSDKQQLRLRQHPPGRGIDKHVFETWFEDNRHLISVTRATEVTKRGKGEFGFTVKNSKEK